MLSFYRGKPIARIEGGQYDGKIVHVFQEGKNEAKQKEESDEEEFEPEDIYHYIKQSDLFKRKKPTVHEINMLYTALRTKKAPNTRNGNMKQTYKKQAERLDELIKRRIKLSSGHMVPLPNDDIVQGDVVYLSAPKGSGKSTWASNYIREYKKMFPKNKFYLFSNVTEDAPLDKLKPFRVPIDKPDFVEDMLDEPITTNELKDKIVLFDDIDVIADKKLRDNIANLRDRCLQEGRHPNIYTVCCSHKIANHKATAVLLTEADKVVCFPEAGAPHDIEYFLKQYCGIKKQQYLDKIMQLPSRWFMVHKRAPQYILTENECFFLSDLKNI